ncbi:MAG: hypothetical protein EPN41_06170 [Candidimonas sp.]|nr:MAG: hypothetical protein EPN41_06170 [Candidimonas sp.]
MKRLMGLMLWVSLLFAVLQLYSGVFDSGSGHTDSAVTDGAAPEAPAHRERVGFAPPGSGNSAGRWCDRVSAMIADVTSLRDARVPVATVQGRVVEVLGESPRPDGEMSGWLHKWRGAVHGIYESEVTREELIVALRPLCRGDVFDASPQLYAETMRQTRRKWRAGSELSALAGGRIVPAVDACQMAVVGSLGRSARAAFDTSQPAYYLENGRLAMVMPLAYRNVFGVIVESEAICELREEEAHRWRVLRHAP